MDKQENVDIHNEPKERPSDSTPLDQIMSYSWMDKQENVDIHNEPKETPSNKVCNLDLLSTSVKVPWLIDTSKKLSEVGGFEAGMEPLILLHAINLSRLMIVSSFYRR